MRARRIIRALAVTTTILCATALTGCGSDEPAAGDGPVKIRMAWGVPGDEIKYVMLADPKRAANNGTCYTLEWKQLTNTAQGAQELAAGTLDGATIGALAVANALDKGADLVITGELFAERKPNFTTTWLVRSDSPVRSAADVKGKTVATAGIGTPTYYIQRQYLKDKAGLEGGKDYQNPELPYSQQEEALAAGRIDVGVFAQPFYGKAMATGKFRPLFSVSDVRDNMPQLLQVFTRSFVKSNQKAAKCFMDDFAAIARYIADPANRDAVVAAEAQIAKIPAEALKGYLMTEQDYYRPANGALDREGLQQTWDFFRANGVFSKALKVSDHVVPALLPPTS